MRAFDGRSIMGVDDGREREEKNEPNLIARKKSRYGLGTSQTVHFSVALAGFIRLQVIHFHPPSSEGGFIPATPQLNPPPIPLLAEGVGPDPGKLGVNPDPTIFDVPNENPDEVVDADELELDVPNRKSPEGGAGREKPLPEPGPEENVPGLGVSHTVHFSVADAGFIRSHAPQVHPFVFVVGGFSPAAPQLNPP